MSHLEWAIQNCLASNGDHPNPLAVTAIFIRPYHPAIDRRLNAQVCGLSPVSHYKPALLLRAADPIKLLGMYRYLILYPLVELGFVITWNSFVSHCKSHPFLSSPLISSYASGMSVGVWFKLA
jgi:hypothetical protein